MSEAPTSRDAERRAPLKPLVIGLTGTIGAGKSTVAARFAELGAVVIDADAVGHETLSRPEVVAEIANRFGREVVSADGAIDRSRLGAIVFADAERRRRLERVVHPLMRKEFERQIAVAEFAGRPFVVLDAAVLFEAGWDEICERVVCVTAPRSVRLLRLREQRGWTDEELTRRENAQIAEAEKRRRCDAVVCNADSLRVCRERVDRLYAEWVDPSHGA